MSLPVARSTATETARGDRVPENVFAVAAWTTGVAALTPLANGAITLGEILVFCWRVATLVCGVLVGPGLVAAALTLPSLRVVGYGLCPTALAPARGGPARRAAVAHLVTGVLLVVAYALVRVVLYLAAIVAGVDGGLPPFGATTALDMALGGGVVLAVWYRYTAGGRRDAVARTLTPYAAYLVGLYPALVAVRWLLVRYHPWVS